jgi:hypothetical protein
LAKSSVVESDVMKRRTLSVVCGVLLLRASALAQSAAATDPVSGNWGSDGSTRLELKFDGKSAISGTAIWRGNGQERRTPIKTGTFNVKTGALKLEGEGMRPDGVTARYVIEGTVDGETMTGTFAFGDRTGTFTFTRQASPPANAGAAMRLP